MEGRGDDDCNSRKLASERKHLDNSDSENIVIKTVKNAGNFLWIFILTLFFLAFF